MPVFMCRWENGSCSFVTTAIKDAAMTSTWTKWEMRTAPGYSTSLISISCGKSSQNQAGTYGDA